VLLELKLPKISEQMDTALIEMIHGAEGSVLKLGSKLLDVSVDLSKAFSQNCPPVSYYRLVARESVWLRQVCVRPGDHAAPGERLALFSTDGAEPLGGSPVREIRVMTAGINGHEEMWSWSSH